MVHKSVVGLYVYTAFTGSSLSFLNSLPRSTWLMACRKSQSVPRRFYIRQSVFYHPLSVSLTLRAPFFSCTGAQLQFRWSSLLVARKAPGATFPNSFSISNSRFGFFFSPRSSRTLFGPFSATAFGVKTPRTAGLVVDFSRRVGASSAHPPAISDRARFVGFVESIEYRKVYISRGWNKYSQTVADWESEKKYCFRCSSSNMYLHVILLQNKILSNLNLQFGSYLQGNQTQ